jgi:hypothetical protein
VWEGFVDKITLEQGAVTYEIGPLSDIANRVYVVYTPIYVGGASIIRGTSMESPLANDTTSQGYYGIIEKSLSAGTCIVNTTYNEAYLLRDQFLKESAYPSQNRSLSFGQRSPVRVTLTILGYWKWLEAYIYNLRAAAGAAGFTTSDLKIRAALAANPNTWAISTDYSNIQTNTSIVYNQEKDNKTAMSIIQAAVACGDPSGNPWMFSILQGRKAYFGAYPSTIDYEYHLTDNRQQLFYWGTSQPVAPWDIQAGKWYEDKDMSVISPSTGTLYQNRNVSFIKSVRYTAPYGFELTEARVGNLQQMLASKNLGVM